LSARTPEDEIQTKELLEILKGFNVRIMDKPFVTTSDPGESLGSRIESELQGLPFKVHYSFDVCLAHGYLYSHLIVIII
jgi:hypothetical protein